MNAQYSRVAGETQPLSAAEVTALLSTLCVKLGFCLPPTESERLCRAVPPSIDAFTDAVFVAEGIQPDTASRHTYRQVRALIADAFQRHCDHEQT